MTNGTNEYGIWKVYGGTNGGMYDVAPLIGVFEGYFIDVTAYAKTLPGWNGQWGSEGRVERLNQDVFKIDHHAVEERIKLINEQRELEKRLAEIKSKTKI